MLRCTELGLRKDDLEEMSVGMVYDLLIEKANDGEKYDLKGQGLREFFERGGKVER